jgi:hypothetical protein
MHFMINQLTVIHMSCARLEQSLGPEWSVRQHPAIETLETAAAKIATYINVLRFRMETPLNR